MSGFHVVRLRARRSTDADWGDWRAIVVDGAEDSLAAIEGARALLFGEELFGAWAREELWGELSESWCEEVEEGDPPDHAMLLPFVTSEAFTFAARFEADETRELPFAFSAGTSPARIILGRSARESFVVLGAKHGGAELLPSPVRAACFGPDAPPFARHVPETVSILRLRISNLGEARTFSCGLIAYPPPHAG